MFNTKLIMVAALLATGSMVSGCGGGGGGENDTSMSNGDNNDMNAGAPASVRGNWIQVCTADDPADAETEYTTTTVVVGADTITTTEMSYIDSGCNTPSVPGEFIANYSVVFPGGTTSTALGSAFHIDVTGESATVDGQSLSDELAQFIDFYTTEYDLIIAVENTLYAGDSDGDLDGTTAALRPTELDLTETYVRQ